MKTHVDPGIKVAISQVLEHEVDPGPQINSRNKDTGSKNRRGAVHAA
jgi:hypothetical protein